MSIKAYLYLLILCGFLYQGSIASLSTKDIKSSLNFVVRNKRVINQELGGDVPTKIQAVKYIVNIRHTGRTICVGSILSHYTVITASSCAQLHRGAYEILSGSAYARGSNFHSVTSISLKYGTVPHENLNGISLLTVDPPFEFYRKTGSISLYTGPVVPGREFEASGWGCYYPLSAPLVLQRRLRTISVPMLNNRDCARDYSNVFPITNQHICTYHPNRHCAHSDIGAPLVLNNKLAGIHIFKGEIFGNRNPDVFLNLQVPEFARWIREQTILM